MRSVTVLAILALTFAVCGAQNGALAGTLASSAGDIGRSIETVVLARSGQEGQDSQQDRGNTVPLPVLRNAGLAQPPLPPMRSGFQLASLGNPYLTALPTIIKPRVLGEEPAEVAETQGQPAPRFVTWMPSRQDPAIVRGGLRQACFHCLLRRNAQKYGVPFRLARAVVEVESNYRRDAVGGVGEIGLMQIRPQTARWLGFEGDDEALFNPRTNLEYGVKYLGKAWRLGEGSLCRAILKYNAGHNASRMNSMSKQYCNKVQAILRDDKGKIALAAI